MLGHEPSIKHYIQVAVSNLVTLAAVVVGTIVIVAFAQGYSFNLATREVEQTGLLRIESSPVSAFVEIDGENKGEKTPYRTTPKAGQHTVRLTRENYRQWTKTVDISGGEVVWLTYPRLIPNEVTTEDIVALTPQHLYGFGPNGDWFIYGRGKTLRIRNLLQQNEEFSVTLPGGATVKNSSQRELYWGSGGEKFVFLAASKEQKPQYFLHEIRSSTTTNITKQLQGYELKELLPANEDYVLAVSKKNQGAHEIINIETGESLSLSDDKEAMYATNFEYAAAYSPESKKMTLWDGTEVVEVPLLEDLTDLTELRVFEQSNKPVIAYSLSDGSVRFIVDAKEAPTLKRVPAQGALSSVSPSGEFVLLDLTTTDNGLAQFAAYHLEDSRVYSFELPELNAEEPVSLRWSGSHHLMGLQDGKSFIVDFDGANFQVLATDATSVQHVGTSSTNYSYEVQKRSKDVLLLRRLNLIAEEN